VPVLLNTSFNNHAEPIIDSAEDALACFLTTDINHLVLGDFIVSKPPAHDVDLTALAPALHPSAVLLTERQGAEPPRHVATFTYTAAKRLSVSPAAHLVLAQADGKTLLSTLLDAAGADWAAVLSDVARLRSERVLADEPGLTAQYGWSYRPGAASVSRTAASRADR
jgi:decarbamoylnovobiocin carbamoyltransferase/7-O-carbamoyltransferase